MAERGPLIVVVNDTPSARYLLSRILRAAGWRVEEAETGLDGLRMVRDLSPDVVVLDVKLPDVLGYEICRRIKSDPATANTTVIQTSATFVTSEGKARGLDSGADAYLAQPFESVELIALVKSLLRLRRSETQALQRAEALGVADKRKDEFLAMLAHELRNPLSAVLVASSLLEEGGTAEELSAIGRTIRRQTRHLARLVDDLLDVARVTSGKIQINTRAIDLGQLVDHVVTSQRATLAKQGLEIELSLPNEELFVEADATRIEQVVLNLLSNAAKYSEKGGRVEVALQVGAGDEPLVRLSVRDHGVGLAAESVPALWDLFFQVDGSLARSKSGLGIGLTMVKRIVEMHGGEVGAASEGLGKGAEFWFELPRVAARTVDPESDTRGRSQKRKLDILLVDDNVDSCELCAIAFRRAGHTATTAHDGQDGLDAAHAGTFDIAVVDIGLPTVDGYEVARRLRSELGARCPYLIALTGYGRVEDRARALEAGFDEHLVKPVDIDRIIQLLSEVRRKDGAA